MSSNGADLHGVKVEMIVMYKECMHNHAAHTTGTVSLDGCRLFEPSGANGTPEAMVCAACKCHRNFHRRVKVELPVSYVTQPRHTSVHIPNPPVIRTIAPHLWAQQQQRLSGSAPPIGPTFPTARQEMDQTRGGQNRSEFAHDSLFRFEVGEGSGWQMMGSERRTRITQQKSARLKVIAERNNWKMFREYSKEEVERICSEIGIKRVAMKSWIFSHRRRRAANNAAN